MFRAVSLFTFTSLTFVCISSAMAQKVAIQIKDKFDDARPNIGVTVEIDGVNSRGGLVRVISGNTTTDEDGRISF
jgi:hypothetical protein